MAYFRKHNKHKTRRQANRSAIFRPRPPCSLLSKGITEVDYKDLSLLRQHLGMEWKIAPGRVNHVCAKMQRQVKTAVKRARYLSLLPYNDHHYTGSKR